MSYSPIKPLNEARELPHSARRLIRTVAAGALVSGIALTAGACAKAEKLPPPLDDHGAVTPAGVAGGPSGATDAGTSDSDAGECSPPLSNAAPTIDERYLDDSVPPALGGAIPVGTYFLSAANVYTGQGGNVGPTGTQIQETLFFDASTFETAAVVGLSDGGVGTPQYANGNYTTVGAMLSLATLCPGATTTTYSYSVLAGALHLYAGQTETIFTLQ